MLEMRIEKGKRIPVGEKEICKEYGLTPTPNSGAGWKYKSDATRGPYRIEIKETAKGQLAVKKEWIEKIEKEANMTGKVPVLLIRIDNKVLACVDPRIVFEDVEEELVDDDEVEIG